MSEDKQEPWKFAQPFPPQPTGMSTKTVVWIIVGSIALAGLIVAAAIVDIASGPNANRQTVVSSPSKPKSSINKSAAAQAARQELIDKTKRMGIVDRIEPGEVVHVYVNALFFGIKRDNQSAIMDAIYQNYYSDDSQVIGIYDAKNGDKLGRYSQLGGLDVKP